MPETRNSDIHSSQNVNETLITDAIEVKTSSIGGSTPSSMQQDGTSDNSKKAFSDQVSNAEELTHPSTTLPETTASTEKSEIENMPAIKNWQSAPGFSALGVLVGAFVWFALAFLIGPLLAWIVQTIVLIVYALVFYRSYFTENPRVTSSKVISFLNYAVSFSSNIVSVWVGWCWNRNLQKSHETKNPKMGISYIIAILYFCLMIGFLFWYESTPHLVRNPDGSYSEVSPQAAQNAQNSPMAQNNAFTDSKIIGSSTSQGTSGYGNSDGSVNKKPLQISDPSSGVTITVPNGWERVNPGDDYPDFVKWVLVPTNKRIQAQMAFLTWDAYGEASEEERAGRTREEINTKAFDEEYVLQVARGSAVDITNETAELIEINGSDYWKVRVDGTSSLESNYAKKVVPQTEIGYYRYDNGYAYYFSTTILDAPDQSIDAIAATLEKIIASATYSAADNESEPADSAQFSDTAGFSIAFPGTPKYNSAEQEAYGYKCTNEFWYEETNSGMYMVSCVTLPSDFPGFDANAVNGGLSSNLNSLCANFDVPSDKREIHYDEFLGCPAAYTTFEFEGYSFIGRDFMKDNKVYTLVAGTSKQEQSEAFVNSFTFI